MSKKTVNKILKLTNLDLFLNNDVNFSVYVNNVCVSHCNHTKKSVYVSYNEKNNQIKEVRLVTSWEEYNIPYENNAIHGFVTKTSYNGLVAECKYENNEKIDDFTNLYWIINYANND